MNLSQKSTDPARAMQWNGKSLAICSKRELIECIAYLDRELYKAKSLRSLEETQITEEPGMTIEEVLTEIEQAYAEDLFPSTTQEERAKVDSGFIGRTAAMTGRRLAETIRRKMKLSAETPVANDTIKTEEDAHAE